MQSKELISGVAEASASHTDRAYYRYIMQQPSSFAILDRGKYRPIGIGKVTKDILDPVTGYVFFDNDRKWAAYDFRDMVVELPRGKKMSPFIETLDEGIPGVKLISKKHGMMPDKLEKTLKDKKPISKNQVKGIVMDLYGKTVANALKDSELGQLAKYFKERNEDMSAEKIIDQYMESKKGESLEEASATMRKVKMYLNRALGQYVDVDILSADTIIVTDATEKAVDDAIDYTQRMMRGIELERGYLDTSDDTIEIEVLY